VLEAAKSAERDPLYPMSMEPNLVVQFYSR